MNKKYLIVMLGIVLLLNLVSAIQVFQSNQYVLLDNSTSRKIASVVYQPNVYSINPFFLSATNVLQDYIPNGKPFEFSLQYFSFIETWNKANPNNNVDFCKMNIVKFSGLSNQSIYISNDSVLLFNDTFYGDQELSTYFVRLNPYEDVVIILDCHFTGNRTLEMPMDFTIITPTWECKACQLYEWSKTEVTILKAGQIGKNKVELSEWIKGLFSLNYEILLVLFWIAIFIITLLVLSMIFLGAYYFYIVVRYKLT
jgi:hypothetical protein